MVKLLENKITLEQALMVQSNNSNKKVLKIDSSMNFYLNKNDRTAHWIVHIKLKLLDTIDFFKRKQIIGNMEAELTELSEINSKTDNLVVTENIDVDEPIPFYLEKEKQ